MYRADTIVARATPAGRGAVAIVRLSGVDAPAIAAALFKPSRGGPLEPWRVRHGLAIDPRSQEPFDEVLAVYMPAPRSYTGEEIVEVQCHGAPAVVERLIAAAVGLGARTAERGEFTRRAVLNGRLDLAQAEAVADLIAADVNSGAAAAWAQLQGALSHRLAGIRADLLVVLSDVEANVDFADEELPEESAPARLDLLDRAGREIDALLAGFPASRRQREGYRTVIAGRPNVGKSSLVNALLGTGRMIVSDEPGTTRDSVEELVDLDGLAFVLTDTAGVRDTESKAEAAAVARARERLRQADIAILVVDGSQSLTSDDQDLLRSVDSQWTVAVINKRDLPNALAADDLAALARASATIVDACALTGQGCEQLALSLVVMARDRDETDPASISRLRHRTALAGCRSALERARVQIEGGTAPELASIELRAAIRELASITEPLDNEAVLDIIFAEFCIGK